MENFLQFKSLGRVRDIRDQLAGLCERVEVVIESNPSSGDTVPIQKALTSGYFFNTVCIALPSTLDPADLSSTRHVYTRTEGTGRPSRIKRSTSTRRRVYSSINRHRDSFCTTSWCSPARSTCDSVCRSKVVGYLNVSTNESNMSVYSLTISTCSGPSRVQQGSDRRRVEQ